MKPPAAQSTGKELPERLDYGHTIAGLQEDWPIVDERGRTWAISLGERMAKELVRRWNAHEEMAATLRVAASTLRLAPDDESAVEKTIQRIMEVLAAKQLRGRE